MIFKIVLKDATGAAQGVNVFGKSIDSLKNSFINFQSGVKNNGFFSTLGNLKTGSLDTSAIGAYNKLADAAKAAGTTMNQAEIDKIIGSTNKATAQLIVNANGAAIGMDAQKAATQALSLKTKILTGVMTGLQAAMNIGAIFLIIKGIELVVKAIDNYKHRVENAQEALDEFNSSIEDKRNTYKSHAELVDKVSESYDKLAEKVNTDTNYNLGLNEDEYADFIDMNNQLAEAYPSLVKGYDESGNAIIDFGDDCSSATQKLRELLKAEQEAMNFEIAQELPETLKNTEVLISDYQEEISKQQKYIEDLNSTKKLIDDINSNQINLFGNQEFKRSDIEQYDELYDLMLDSARDFVSRLSLDEKISLGNVNLNENDFVRRDMHSFWFDYVHLPEDLKTRLQNIVKENVESLTRFTNDELANAQRTLKDAEANKESTWEDFTSNLVAGMTSQASYQTLDAAEQELAKALVGGIDSSFAEAMGDDPLQYVRENIMNSLSKMKFSDEDKMSLANSIAEFTSLDISSMDVTGKEEAQMKLIEAIKSIIPDETISTDIIVKLGLGDVEKNYQSAYDALGADINAKLGAGFFESDLTQNSINSYFDKLNINTEEEIKAFRTLFNETGDLATAFDLYEEKIKATEQATDNLNDTTQKFSKLEMIETINSMADGFDILDNIYADIYDKEDFDFMNLDKSKFEDAFGDLGEEYTEFIETVSESPSDITACQEAFDKLATAFINSKGILENLTEENANVATAMLRNMGIANAEEIVMAQLAYNTEMASVEKQFLAKYTHDVANATIDEVTEFLAENEVTQTVQQSMAQLVLSKISVNEETIDTSKDIDNIISLANAAGASAIALAKLEEAKAILNSKSDGSIGWLRRYEAAEKTIADIESGNFDWGFELLDPADFKVTNYESYKPKYTGGDQTADARTKAAEDAAKEATDSLVDFFERRVEVLEQAFGNLEAGIQNVLGAKAKNSVLAGQLEILDEETRNYTDAIGMYQEAAEGYLSLIPEAYREAAKNGDVSILQINDEQTKEAIDNYQQWANKVAECTQKLEELKAQIRELELEKFNNIIKDFTDQFDLHGIAIDNIDKQIGLLEEAGELIGSSYYTKQIEQSEKQLALLEQQKLAMVEQLNDSLSSGRIQQGTDEWLEMVNALQEVEGNILDCKTSIEEFNNALLEIQWIVFERIQTEFGNLNSEMENLAGLFDDFNDIKVSDGKGTWTKEAIATLGLYAQQYELARYQVQQYSDAIEKLKEDYLAGKYSATEYMDKLAELSQGQWDAVNSAESLEDAIISLNETRVNEEIEAYRELIDAQIELIEQTDKLKKKQDELAEKSKTVADIEKQLAAMMYDNSAATVAKRKQLEAQLAEAKKDLSDTEYEYSKDTQIESLNKQFEDQETLLQESLKDRETLLNQSFNTVKENATLVGEQIVLVAQEHGVIVSDALISAWTQGENAIAAYGQTLSAQSSVFIGNIIGVENQVIALQNDANVASVALSNMFATRADNLVSQLQASWYEEDNLNYATGLLHQNLIDTLQGSYNVSGITSALKAIEDAANRAADAIKNIPSSPSSPSTDDGKRYYHMGHNGDEWYVKDLYGSYVKYYDSFEEATKALDKLKKQNYNYKAYAKGSKRIPEDQLAWTDEHGEREMIIRRSDGAILTRLEKNDAIANANLAENLFKWGEINPNRFMQGLGSNTTVSKINVPMRESKPNITLDYDLNIGSFTDGEHLLSTIQKVSKESATKLLNDINRDFRIHSR